MPFNLRADTTLIEDFLAYARKMLSSCCQEPAFKPSQSITLERQEFVYQLTTDIA